MRHFHKSSMKSTIIFKIGKNLATFLEFTDPATLFLGKLKKTVFCLQLLLFSNYVFLSDRKNKQTLNYQDKELKNKMIVCLSPHHHLNVTFNQQEKIERN